MNCSLFCGELTPEAYPGILGTFCTYEVVLFGSRLKNRRQIRGSNGKKVYVILVRISALGKQSVGKQDEKGGKQEFGYCVLAGL
jgi:hypothetical protein